MRNSSKRHSGFRFAAASHEAAGWFARLKDDRCTPADEENLDRELSRSPGLRDAFDRMKAIWERCEGLQNHPLVLAERTRVPGRRRAAPLGKGYRRFPSASYFAKPLVAGVAVLLVISVVWLSQEDLFAPQPFLAEYRSGPGVQKTVALADGSTALLDTATTISADFSSGIRRVELIEGRALFSVVYRPDEPFIVAARDTEVRVLGTEFDVSMLDGRIAVAVLEGRVHVGHRPDPTSGQVSTAVGAGTEAATQTPERAATNSWGDTGGGRTALQGNQEETTSRIITSGQELVFDEKQGSFEIRPANVKRISAWRTGKLDFDRAPLDDVVAEVNRYASQKMRIGSDDLSSMRISMVFGISDCDDFLGALYKIVPVEAETLPDGEILLTRRE